MDYHNILPDFIDGLLSPEEEKAMYYQLSQDEELYIEYKKYKAIFGSIEKSKNDYYPAPELTAKIFTSLNIEDSGAAQINNNIFKFYSAKFKYVAAAAAIFLLFVISDINDNTFKQENIHQTATSQISEKYADTRQTSTFAKPDIKTTAEKVNSSVSYSKITEDVAYDNSPSNYPLIPNEDNTAGKTQIIENNVDITTDIAQPQPQEYSNAQSYSYDEYNDSENYSQSEYNGTEEQYANYDNDNYYYDNQYYNTLNTENNYSKSFSAAGSQFSYDNYTFTNFSLPADKFTLELKNTVYFNKVNSKINTNFSNIGVAIYYSIFDDLSLGLDIRDESYQKLSTQLYEPMIDRVKFTDVNYADAKEFVPYSGTEIPTTTVGVAIKYDWKNRISTKITPTAQLMIGKNSEGIVGRLSLGVYLKTIYNLTANLGLEYSTLAYEIQGISNNSSKVGINCGLAYNF